MRATDFLRGIRVLDLSQYIPGPYAALMLADLGADVLKVEPPGGDPMRYLGPGADIGASAYYAVMNGGKRVLRIDLKTPAGRENLLNLIGNSDVLVESYRPGVLARLGLSREVLMAANPRLIHCAISCYGQTGPLAGRAGHDLNCMAFGGGLIASGIAERPVMTAPPISDFAAALQATATISAALLARDRSGKGAYIDLGMADTVLAWQSCMLTEAVRRGPQPLRATIPDNGGAAYYNIYETADRRFVVIAADEDKFWANFCRAVGRGDWVARKSEPLPQSDLIAEVRTLIATRSRQEWDGLLEAVDCCYQPVLEPEEVLSHPQTAARALIQRSDRGGPIAETLYPAWIDGNPPASRSPYREVEISEAIAAWGNRRIE